jgi:hypothetical protein
MGCVGVDWIKSVFALHCMPSTTVVRIEVLLSLFLFSQPQQAICTPFCINFRARFNVALAGPCHV